MVDTKYFEELVTTVRHSINNREARVLELRFGFEDGMRRTLEEVGKDFGVTRERIRQIESKGIKELALQFSSDVERNSIEGYQYPNGGGGLFTLRNMIADSLKDLGGTGHVRDVSDQLGCDLFQLLWALRLIVKVEKRLY